jgi:hypothetical protein
MGEMDVQHAAFLIWATQPPSHRNMRAVGRIVGRSDGTIRNWATRWSWHDRADDPDATHHSAYLIRHMYKRLVVPCLKEFPFTYKLKEATTYTDPEAPEDPAHKKHSPVTTKPHPKPSALSESETELQLQRLNTMLQAMFADITNQMVSEKSKVNMRDFPSLVRTWLLLNGAPTDITKQVPGSQPAQQLETVRVQLAKRSGNPAKAVLRAIKEDIDEMKVVVDTMVTAQEHGNVVAFPGSNQENSEESSG